MPVGAITAAATVGGAAIASSGARRQASAVQNASDSSNALQQQIFNQQRADLAPWRASGAAALQEINRRLGLGSAMPQTATGTGTGAFGYPIGSGQNIQARRDGYSYGEPSGPNPSVLALPSIDGGIDQVSPGGGGVTPIVPSGGGGNPLVPAPEPQINPGVPGGGPQSPMPQVNGGPNTQTGNPNVLSDPQNRYGGFYASPGYQFRFDEGNRAITGNRAASGMLQSGDTLRALNRYGQDYASNEFNTQLNQLFSVAGLGQTATGQGNALASNYGAQVGANNMNTANALASSYGTQANAWGNALGQIGGYAAYAWPGSSGGGNPATGRGGDLWRLY